MKRTNLVNRQVSATHSASVENMRQLGFRFDEEAVIINRTAHRADCPLRPSVLPPDTVRIAAGETYAAERCPRACPCAVPFETQLGYTLEAA